MWHPTVLPTFFQQPGEDMVIWIWPVDNTDLVLLLLLLMSSFHLLPRCLSFPQASRGKDNKRTPSAFLPASLAVSLFLLRIHCILTTAGSRLHNGIYPSTCLTT
ncbi:hypothetical protein P389DRAFT_101426 [Cystobasidium minutum MCA 4210]|uniref:uncharacterized protein n=1 Tax=Cystobasidium minutum MCA 4210 TaxID=1397322 RepID=UPI0034CEFDA0|eukprot:jgi/Rhomi1/101426/CE101425_397